MGITQSAGGTRATIDKLIQDTDQELLSRKKEIEEGTSTTSSREVSHLEL